MKIGTARDGSNVLQESFKCAVEWRKTEEGVYSNQLSLECNVTAQLQRRCALSGPTSVFCQARDIYSSASQSRLHAHY